MEARVVHMSDAAWSRAHRSFWRWPPSPGSACALGYASDPQQFYASYLVGFMYFLTIALGAAFFLMVWHLSGAVWSVTVRRLMETVMATLPLAPLLFLPVVAGHPVALRVGAPGVPLQRPGAAGQDGLLQPDVLPGARGGVLRWSGACSPSASTGVRGAGPSDGIRTPIRKSVAWSAPGTGAAVRSR